MFWILLPAYNEEESLPPLLPKIAEQFADPGDSYRIVVVDDGSRDQTATMLEEFAKKYPLAVVTHSLNRGLGETERDGFEYIADRCDDDDIVIRMDCDDTHEPTYMDALRAKLDEGFDVVNTSRFQPGGGQKGVNAYRGFISRAANLFMKLMFGIAGMKDYSCGYRAYRGQILKDAISIYGNGFLQLRGLGFTSTLETVVKLHLMGCRFAEVPFVLRYDQKVSSSKMVSSITTFGYFVMAFLYHWPFGGWKKQLRGLATSYRKDRNQAMQTFGRFDQRSSPDSL